MNGIVNPFPERTDGLPVIDEKTGRVVGTAFERKPRPTHIRLSCAFGCLAKHNGKVFMVLSWCGDGSPMIEDPTPNPDPGGIYVSSSEWVPAEAPGGT